MRLGLNLGLTRNQGGAADPYASAIAAYDLARDGAYTLSTGRVDSLTDFGPNGYNLTQSVSGDRPTVGTMTDGKAALVFTNAEEWLFTNDAALGTLANDAASMDFSVSFVVELNGLATTQVFIGWTDPAANVNEMTIGMNVTGDLRISRKNATPTTNTADSPPVFTATGTTYAVTVTFSGGNVTAFVNGVNVISSAAFAAGTPTIAASRFMIGAKSALTATLGTEGYIHSVVIEAN